MWILLFELHAVWVAAVILFRKGMNMPIGQSKEVEIYRLHLPLRTLSLDGNSKVYNMNE